MSSPYTIALSVGGKDWLVEQGDVPDMSQLTDGLPLDGMAIGWAYTDDAELFPSQPQPVTLQLSIMFDRTADARTDVYLGAPVSMEMSSPAVSDLPTAAFEGVIGALSVRPHDFGPVYSFTAVDTTAGLGELIVGDAPWGIEDIQARLAHIVDAVELTGLYAGDSPPLVPGADAVLVAARDVDAQPALDLFTKYLRQWPAQTTLDPESHRVILQAVPQSGLPTSLRFIELPDHITHGRYPGELGAAGTMSFTRAALSGAGRLEPWVIEAGWVDFDAEWSQNKRTNPTRVSVSNDALGIVTATSGEQPPVTATVDGVELTDTSVMAELARMYLPDVSGQAGWTVDKFTLRGDAPGIDLGTVPLIIGRQLSEVEPYTSDVLTGVVVVDNIPAELAPAFQYPAGDAFYAGLLTSATLTVADGTWTCDFTLRPDLPRPPAGGDGDAMTWNNLGATYPALTINDVDAWVTHADTRLLRRL